MAEAQPFVVQPRQAASALTKTGGALAYFTHSLNPYIGCRFGCSYCYVRALPVHTYNPLGLAWGDYVQPKENIAEKLEKELRTASRRHKLGQIRVFMSSSTDPYQGLERTYRLTRACLEVFTRYPVDLLVIQTRSPLVEADFDLIRTLPFAWLSMTVETEDDEVRKIVTPACSSIPRRLETMRRAREAGIHVQAAISPMLPNHPERFAEILAGAAERVIVDTFNLGDGSGGQRTARTTIPQLYREQGWGRWHDPGPAQKLARALAQYFDPEQIVWSGPGFNPLLSGSWQFDTSD